MRLFDTHAHLNSEEFSENLAAVVERANAAGVAEILVVGTTVASSQRAVEVASLYSGLSAAVGIQPNYVAQAEQDAWSKIEQLAARPGVVAIGETGLDRYWNDTPFEQQQDYFDRHLRLSQRTGLPFIVHMRDCGEDVLAMLREAAQRGPLRGVMHSFTGEEALAEACLSLGLHVSFAGMVTYKKSEALRAVAAIIPADRILIETDSPYLSPHPCRTQRPNEPALLVHTAECLAAVRKIPLPAFAEQTTVNAQRLFLRNG